MINLKEIKLTLVAAAICCAGPVSAEVNLSAETAVPTSVPGTTVLALSELASQAGIANIQVKTEQTLTNTLQSLAEGKIDITAVPSLLPFLMSKGAGPYANLGKEKGAELASKVAMLYTYRLAIYGLSAFDSKNFAGWDAVEGATLFNGPPRGAALTKSRGLIKLVTGLDDGKGYTGVQTNWGQAVKTISDGSVDAAVTPLSFPDGRLGQASASGAMTIFSTPKDVFEGESGVKYGSAPGVVSLTVPIVDKMFGANISVSSEDEFFRGYGDVGGDAVNVSMDEELAYSLTKTFIDNMDTYKAKAPFMSNTWLGEIDVEFTGMCGANPTRYHPGAVRAWEEAGYTVPDCAKP